MSQVVYCEELTIEKKPIEMRQKCKFIPGSIEAETKALISGHNRIRVYNILKSENRLSQLIVYGVNLDDYMDALTEWQNYPFIGNLNAYLVDSPTGYSYSLVKMAINGQVERDFDSTEWEMTMKGAPVKTKNRIRG